MNTLHRRSVEEKFAQPLDASNITPLADIESIKKGL
jgi:hypothetical protein